MLTEQVIGDGSLRAREDGFSFDLRMPWYRALPLSSLEGLEVRIDGEQVKSKGPTPGPRRRDVCALRPAASPRRVVVRGRSRRCARPDARGPFGR